MARPLVQVFNTENGSVERSVKLPGVFVSPIRPDVVHFVHSNVNKNKRQAYAVNKKAGHDCSADSWGTGRAVSRIPRVNGGGTHRAGQAAFGNMCRGGRMFAPTKTWRKWHRKVNLNQRRYAVCSALAASALTPLVMARGHRVEQIGEIPLVLSDSLESTKKTKTAMEILERHGAMPDVDRVKASRQVRRGKGKMRDRRYVQRTGPLVVYLNDGGVSKAFRNIPGVDTCHVDRLNILQLAPGGHLGRFIIWSEAAFNRLNALYGTTRRPSSLKKGYRVPRAIMTNPDISRIINSDEVQSHVRPAIKGQKYVTHKKNPLKNLGVLLKLNPHAKAVRRAELKAELNSAARKEQMKAARQQLSPKEIAASKARRVASKAFYAKNFATPEEQ